MDEQEYWERERAAYGDCEEDREDEEWRRRRAFFTCQPHMIYGFRLRDHTWEKLLVRHVRLVQQKWGPWQELVVGETQKATLERLLITARGNNWVLTTFGPRKPAKFFMTFRGPAGSEAIDAVSIMTKRPLCRVLISAETLPGFADRLLQQIAPLARRWRCVVVIEDLLGVCYAQSQTRESRNATLTPLLRFLDTFKGLVILSLPDEHVQLDPRLDQRVCANFHFQLRDATPASRQTLWRQYIKRCTGREQSDGDLSPEEEKHIEKLATIELSWDAIRSLVNAATRLVDRADFINWDLLREINWDVLLDLAEKKASHLSPPAVARLGHEEGGGG